MKLIVMENAQLKREAETLVQECGLPQLLAAYPAWFIGGSYSYDLMCWRDLDIYVLDTEQDLKRCFEVAYELSFRLGAKKSRFTNNVGSEPDGLYWGIKLGNERQGAWKLDIWFLNSRSYEQHADYSAKMNETLTAETRAIILAIKEAYWRRPEYRDSITSDQIYRAVLEKGVKDTSDFKRSIG
jgi:hypothetical protein